MNKFEYYKEYGENDDWSKTLNEIINDKKAKSIPMTTEQQLENLKRQVEMLQKTVDSLQQDRKNLTGVITRLMQEDDSIQTYINSQLEKIYKEAKEAAFKDLMNVADTI